MGACLDGDGSVAPEGLDQLPDGGFEPPGDGEGGEHDGEVGFDGVFLVVVDRAGGQV